MLNTKHAINQEGYRVV